MSEMPREEPQWVQRMRAAGYNIRVGTLDGPMSYLPDAFFYPPPGVPRRLVRRLDATSRGCSGRTVPLARAMPLFLDACAPAKRYLHEGVSTGRIR